jgi:hypothetical protein
MRLEMAVNQDTAIQSIICEAERGITMKRKLLTGFIACFTLLALTSCSAVHINSPQESVSTTDASLISLQESISPTDASLISPQESVVSDTFSPGIVFDNNTMYVSASASRSEEYTNTDDLVARANFIFSGVCVSSAAVFQNDMLYSISEVEVKKAYSGDISKGDVLSVVEMGGRTTYGEFVKNCNVEKKDFESEGETIPDSTNYVFGLEGYFPMKMGDDVLIFAVDTSGFIKGYDKPLYSICGTFT